MSTGVEPCGADLDDAVPTGPASGGLEIDGDEVAG
jgi:hypothetical protein